MDNRKEGTGVFKVSTLSLFLILSVCPQLTTGVFKWKNGDAHDGLWKDNKREGAGVWTGSNGNVYEGSWVAGVKVGHGTYSWAKNGNMYQVCLSLSLARSLSLALALCPQLFALT